MPAQERCDSTAGRARLAASCSDARMAETGPAGAVLGGAFLKRFAVTAEMEFSPSALVTSSSSWGSGVGSAATRGE